MPGKGSKNCCCNGCYEKPSDRSLGIGVLQEQQQHCCGCVPKQICVTLLSYASGNSASFIFDRDCSAVEGDPILYSGDIALEGTTYHIEFLFRVYNGACYLCLRSADLGVTGTVPDDCFEITDVDRQSPNYFCMTMLLDALPISWVVDDLTVSFSVASNVAIEGRQDCLNEYGAIVEDTHPIKNLCGGCGCICECACIYTYGDDMTATVEEACLVGTTSWITGSGTRIDLVENYVTGCCELELVTTSIELEAGSLFPAEGRVAIGGITNPCPNPIAQWLGFRPTGEAVFYDFICSSGCGCAPVQITGCCEGQYPRVLTVTMTTTCPACPTLTFSLVYDSQMSAWVTDQAGNFTSGSGMCGHEISLSLSCDGYNWQLAFNASPCTTAGASAAATSCDPLIIEFTFDTSGITCCGILDPLINPTITITITE